MSRTAKWGHPSDSYRYNDRYEIRAERKATRAELRQVRDADDAEEVA